ncbi:hypothetical protein J6W32_04670 [bacterium]|nr:hypothetical protein [bacterium]
MSISNHQFVTGGKTYNYYSGLPDASDGYAKINYNPNFYNDVTYFGDGDGYIGLQGYTTAATFTLNLGNGAKTYSFNNIQYPDIELSGFNSYLQNSTTNNITIDLNLANMSNDTIAKALAKVYP